MSPRIFLDCDGVLADFDGHGVNLFGCPPREAEAIGFISRMKVFGDFGIDRTTLVAAVRLAKEARGPFKPDYRHVARGTGYRVLARGTLQTERPLDDNTPLVAYVDATGKWWFRMPEEFHDGRFERIAEPAG